MQSEFYIFEYRIVVEHKSATRIMQNPVVEQ